MNVKLQFLGGAGTVTGSKYLLKVDGKNILIDCGLFQGPRNFRELNWYNYFEDAGTIDAVVLTHAHLDHSGYLPKLVQSGYNGPIYCTRPTKEILKLLLLDSAKLQEEEADYARKKKYTKHNPPKPLYTIMDAEKVFPLLNTVSLKSSLELFPNISVTFHDSGHILGAASVQFQLNGNNQTKTVLFSGDIGKYNDPIHKDPTEFKEADILIMESTYGDRTTTSDAENEIMNAISNTFNDGGILLIPAFAVGRTQLMAYYLSKLMTENRIQKVPVYIDSPMAVKVSGIYEDFQSYLKPGEIDYLNYPYMKFCETPKESRSLNKEDSFAIIVSASGMCNGGRILHHLYHHLPNPKDHLLFVGYQGAGTRGRAILENKPITIFGEPVKVNCKVERINGLSAHADQTELLSWASKIENAPKKTFIVHGEKSASESLKSELENQLEWNNVFLPEHLETFALFDNI